MTANRLVPALALLLTLWATRLWALDIFPLHVDEGIHIAWAVEVWNGHPFWNISDAKIISHWPIALFYPQNAPVYTARLPVILVAMLGLAAGWSLLRNVFGARVALLGALLLVEIAPFALALYRDPGAAPLPDFMRRQYVTEQSAGFGLREAASALAETTEPGVPIVGSMVRDSCRRANYYAPPGRALICADRLGADAINAALAAGGVVYVLADRPPFNGVDVSALDADAARIAVYPRPGESEADASIVLWRVVGR